MLMAVVVEQGVDVGRVIDDTLAELQMTHKEVWLTAGYTEGDWSNARQGRRSLDLWKLRQLPLRWWFVFLARLGSALILDHYKNLHAPYRMARASIPEDAKKEGRAS